MAEYLEPGNRIFGQYGQVIEETGIAVEENRIWEGENQFPLLPRHGGAVISKPKNTESRTPSISGNSIYFKSVGVYQIEITDMKGKSVRPFFRAEITSDNRRTTLPGLSQQSLSSRPPMLQSVLPGFKQW